MVGGPGQATDCSFSITLGILLGRDSRQEAREGHGPAPAWAHARGGVAAAGRLRFARRRHHRLPGRGRSRRAATSFALTIANANAQAHPKANAAPDSATDAPTDRNSSPGSHRTTIKGPHVAPGRGRRHNRRQQPAACRCNPGRGLSSGGGACPDGAGCERCGLGIAVGYAELVPVDDGRPAGRPRPAPHDAARHCPHAALSVALALDRTRQNASNEIALQREEHD